LLEVRHERDAQEVLLGGEEEVGAVGGGTAGRADKKGEVSSQWNHAEDDIIAAKRRLDATQGGENE
jgi:hypothetical protein